MHCFKNLYVYVYINDTSGNETDYGEIDTDEYDKHGKPTFY